LGAASLPKRAQIRTKPHYASGQHQSDGPRSLGGSTWQNQDGVIGGSPGYNLLCGSVLRERVIESL